MSIKEKAEDFLESIPLKEGDCLLVALSAGKDSMVLLWILWEIFCEKQEEKIPCFSLAVAHFNHKARGEASEEDQAFVKKFVDSLKSSINLEKNGYANTLEKEAACNGIKQEMSAIPLFLGSGSVLSRAKEEKKGFEETARDLRYGFLQETADEIQKKSKKNCYIVTAHHANDNLETLLLHLARGAGMQGLSGIPPQRGNIIRPLLQVTRSEIALFVEEHSLPYREDLSNAEEQYRRNFVRHQVIPKLEQLNPSVVAHSAHTISILRGENDFLNSYVGENLVIDYEGEVFSQERKAVLDIGSLLALPESLQGRAMQYVVEQVVPTHRLSQKQREEMLKLAKNKKPSGIFSSFPLRTRRCYDKMIVDTVDSSQPNQEKKEKNLMTLQSGETYLWEGWEVTAVKSDVPYGKKDGIDGIVKVGKTPKKQNTMTFFCIDVDKLYLRSRKQGDTLKIASRPRKTLKKWMIEEKIPQHLREELPVFVTETDQVVAVVDLEKEKAFVDSGFLPQERANDWKIRLTKREA